MMHLLFFPFFFPCTFIFLITKQRPPPLQYHSILHNIYTCAVFYPLVKEMENSKLSEKLPDLRVDETHDTTKTISELEVSTKHGAY